MSLIDRFLDRVMAHPLILHPLAQRVLKWRFLKFGTVGASGTFVNLGGLYLAQEFLFLAIEPREFRLNFSLALAIFVATVNNFAWNRIWTWKDRQRDQGKSVIAQFGQYAVACWVGILLQVVITKVLVLYLHYLMANLIAIVFAGVFNFVVNDFWTFRHHRPPADVGDGPREAVRPCVRRPLR